MKKIIILICTLFIMSISVYAINSFNIDSKKLSFNNSKNTKIKNNFNEDYNIKYSSNNNKELEDKLIDLSKKTTFLLLGEFNNTNESVEKYYKRHQDYLNLRYAPVIPKDESNMLGYDTSSKEWYDDTLSGMAIPGMFFKLDELNVIYKSFGDIRVTFSDDLVLSTVVLPNVIIKKQKEEEPSIYEKVKTNIVLYYTFKKLDNEYKLYYLWAQLDDELNEYSSNIEDNENNGTLSIAPNYNTDLKEIYDFSKLDKVTEEQVNNIYNINKDNIVILKSFYNNFLTTSSTGFFINNGLIVTTWKFIEQSLKDAQYLTIEDINGNLYELDGIVTTIPDSDIAILKLKENIERKVNLAESNISNLDPVFMLNSKSGMGLTNQSGIVIAVDDYINTSIPISEIDSGAPLINIDGNVVGMMTSKSINSSISLSTNVNVLKDIQNKFNNIEFNKIESMTFEKLKSEYYYIRYDDEQITNNIKESTWKKYSKIGNIEKNIKLELKKASYKDGIVTLRYYNSISNYIDNMQFASEFKKELIKTNYKEILQSKEKSIYENNKYKVIIMSEFNYLIVIMVKL